MKNIYNLTKGQLITLWAFGAFTWLYLGLGNVLDDETVFFLLGAIPLGLIFYTIGWRNNKKGSH